MATATRRERRNRAAADREARLTAVEERVASSPDPTATATASVAGTGDASPAPSPQRSSPSLPSLPSAKVGARKLVLVSVVALLVIDVYRAKNSSAQVDLGKRLWGTGIIWVMLSVLADFAPQVAGPFSVLVVLGSLTNGGDAAIQNLLGSVGKGGATLTTPASAGAGTVAGQAAFAKPAPAGSPVNKPVTPGLLPPLPFPATGSLGG